MKYVDSVLHSLDIYVLDSKKDSHAREFLIKVGLGFRFSEYEAT